MTEEGATVHMEQHLTWTDIFPWLGAASTSDPGWHMTPSNLPDAAEHHGRLNLLAEVIGEQFMDWPIEQLFVALPLETDLAALPFSMRARHAILRRGYRTFSDLQGVRTIDIFDWRQVGAGTIHDLLRVLAIESIRAALDPRSGQHPSELQDETSEKVRTAEAASSTHDPVTRDLQVVARWLVAKGHEHESLLSERLTVYSPIDVVEARDRLIALTPADVLEPHEINLDTAEQLSQVLSSLPSRDIEVLARRFLADRPETLDTLGKEFGVTRERIRQLEAKARASLVGLIQPGGALEMVASAARETIGAVLPLAELLIEIPALERKVDLVGQPAWRVVDRLDDAYEIEDGWCAAPTVGAVRSDTAARLDEYANEYGIVAIETLGHINPRVPPERDRVNLVQWLEYCGYKVVNTHVFTRVKSIPDRICAELFLRGTPMSNVEIIEIFHGQRSSNSIRNALGTDSRLVRIGRDEWALAEWGTDAYEGIRAAIRRVLAENNGAVQLAQLQQALVDQYGVSPTSVATYASLPPFETSKGFVKLASTRIEVRKTPQGTKRMFRIHDSWNLRVTITKEHLRGSGFVAPAAIAGLLNLQPGDTIELSSRLGTQKVYWTGIQTSIGSIRRFLLDFDVDTGDEIFVRIYDNHEFDVVPCAPTTGNALHDALALAGLNTKHPADARALLASSIGLSAHTSVAELTEEFRARGDGDIADLLIDARTLLRDEPPAPTESEAVAIDEIMDLL